MATVKIRVNGEELFGYDEAAREKIAATVDALPGAPAIKTAATKARQSAGAVRGGVGRIARSSLSFTRIGLTETAKFGVSARSLSTDPDQIKARAAEAGKKAAAGLLRQAERTREIATQTALEALSPWLAAAEADAEAEA